MPIGLAASTLWALTLSFMGALTAMGISFLLRNPSILRWPLASALALMAVARIFLALLGEKPPPAVDLGMTYAFPAIAITLVANAVVNTMREPHSAAPPTSDADLPPAEPAAPTE